MARSGNAMAGMGGLGKFTELRQRLMFVVGALLVYRIGCYIPVPGVNPEAMLRLMELSPQERRAIGARGREHIRNTYGLGHIVDRWESLYREVLARRGSALAPSPSV